MSRIVGAGVPVVLGLAVLVVASLGHAPVAEYRKRREDAPLRIRLLLPETDRRSAAEVCRDLLLPGERACDRLGPEAETRAAGGKRMITIPVEVSRAPFEASAEPGA